MHGRPFAHSYTIWINSISSTNANARKMVAADLIRAIDASERFAKAAYGEVEMNRMITRFEEAKEKLREMMK